MKSRRLKWIAQILTKLVNGAPDLKYRLSYIPLEILPSLATLHGEISHVAPKC